MPRTTEAGDADAYNPADCLLHLVACLLAPMFLLASNGDITFARMAALQTVTSYRARTDEDLISIMQIVGFGLAALASLSRSMEDDLSLSMMLRLRGNANACNRSAEHNRRALRDIRASDRASSQDAAPAAPATSPDNGYEEADVRASVAAALEQTGQSAPPPEKEIIPEQPTAPISTAPISTAPVDATQEERQIQAAWAAAMARAAAKYLADLPNLPPAQRREATIRATALSTTAQDVLVGNIGPRPRPGDLSALMQPPRP
jgi:hypothetical protein